ncbi:MAG TPA: alpha/beta fold hydrolase [Longimicrobiales bacterium]
MLSSSIHSILAATLLLIAVTPARAQDRLSGNWRGYWFRAGDSLAVTMKVQRDSAGRYAVTFGSERLRVSGIPFAPVVVTGCCDVSLTLRGDRTTAVFTGTVRGDSLTGSFQEGSSQGSFAFVRMRSETQSYEERTVAFANGAVSLAGTLLLPRAGRSLAAVVFAHGSGAEGRWASRFLAEQLASRGTAALIFDKRGVGESTGDWRTASLEDLAGDVAAAIAMVQQQPRIDPKRVGLHGHSQGGTLAPLIATRAPGVAFVIASAAAGPPTDSVEIFSILNSIYPRAATSADSADARAYVHELVRVAYHGDARVRLDSLAQAFAGRPWFFAPPALNNGYWSFSRMFGAYRALEWWARVQVPVLLVYGGADQRVPAAESAARIANTLLHAGNGDVTVRIFPGADHTFRLPPGPSDWPVTAPGYVAAILDFVRSRGTAGM